MNPERVGPYQILEKLGSGGMGNVYLGKHSDTAEQAAVKVLTASLAREPGFVERFTREIDAMRKLDNPRIVKLFDSGSDGETYYYAMEYVPGETLMTLMRRERRIPWRRAVEIVVQVCQALKSAHDAGIIHRDLKPSNLLVAPDGTVKLTDFGVAQVFASERLTVTGGIIGTAEYMSPEQAQGKRATKRSDLYSLGAIFYAMVTGRTPFSGSTAVEVIQKHKFGLFDRPGLIIPDLPQRVEETICRLLEKDPDKRFPDAFVLLRHLEQIVRLEDFAENAGATLDDDSDSLGPGPTVVATTYPGDAGLSRRPGPATVMKGLLREELSRDARGGPVASLFNNVFVLVLMLALVVAGGIWWFWPRRLSPQEQFDRGVALMDSHPEPGPEWLRARREFFEPLLAADAATWQDDVAPYLRKIELYELSRAARGKRAPRSSAPASEAERFLQLALHCRQTGDLARAERTLSALRALLSGDEKQSKMYDYAGALLDELHRERAKSEDRAGLLESSLARATALVDDGKIDQAREIWGGILELYADDPEADDAVRAARAAIEKHTDNGPAAPQR